MSVTKLIQWKELVKHQKEMQQVKMLELFTNDSQRFNNFSIKFNDILFDYSKNIITNKTLDLLVNLAKAVKLKEKIEAMFAGARINTTEQRSVLHTALRVPPGVNRQIIIDGVDIISNIHSVLNRMAHFVNQVHTDKKYTNIVNIGIGGSDLGPSMICQALDFYAIKGINSYFVSNVDGTDILTTLSKLDPASTLFIISSKTFTTQETMANAHIARHWIESNNYNISEHFIALSTNIDACKLFGIREENIFEFWDWVGGRYSLWSAIGMSIALYIGMDNFRELLLGGYEMDKHFQNADYTVNIPIIMALLGIWYNNFFSWHSHCVIPYDHYLRRFPAFLQQLDMESNGKYITKDGENVNYSTGPIIWGEAGTNAQHSFFQLIHQGTQIIPADFISFINNVNDDVEQHKILLSNFFAQTEALMCGKNEAKVRTELKAEAKNENEINKLTPHKVFIGNRPTNTILIRKLTPYTLGNLIAMYEHKVLVQGIIWNINSFDQWGVELGKQLAKKILPELNNNEKITSHDSSTNGLINYYNTNKIQ